MRRFLRIALFLAAIASSATHAQYYPPEEPEGGGFSYTALWWVPAESGWGLNTNHQDNTVFATLFTYAPDGQPMWLVAPALSGLPGQTLFSGALYRTTGPAFDAQPWSAIAFTQVGTMSIEFISESVARLTYSFDGTSVTKTVQRQVFSSPVPECEAAPGSRAGVANYQDLWWNPAESGWGLNMVQQGTIIFATLFTYAPSGRDLWIVAPDLRRQPDASYTGAIYTTRGTSFDATPWTDVQVTEVGTMTVWFTNGERAALSYTYNGTTVNKTIQRQQFGTLAPVCR
jgi:hypothetical protein